MKLYTLFKTQDPENHTLFSGTYLYRPNEGVFPPPPPGMYGSCWNQYAVVEHMEGVMENFNRKQNIDVIADHAMNYI